METETSRTHCIRCGECCLKSSPTLQEEDLSQVIDGRILTHDLYTIRTGELVRDNIKNQLKISEVELIKLKEKDPEKGCIQYDEKDRECKVYDYRPTQCAAQTCWDDSEYMQVFNRPKLTRNAVIQDEILLGLMEQHEKRCNYGVLEQLVKQIEKEGAKAIEEILELLKFDHEIRPFVSEKLGIDLSDMDFIFGRPLTGTIAMFGLKVKREPEGSFLLTMEDTPPDRLVDKCT